MAEKDRMMSHVFHAINGSPIRYDGAKPPQFTQLERCADDLKRRGSQIALDMVGATIVFFSAPTMRLLDVNRAACQCLGYSQHQLRRLSLFDIVPRGKRASLAESIQNVLLSPTDTARIQTAFRHQSGMRIPVDFSLRALQKKPVSILIAVGQPIAGPNSSVTECLDAGFRDSLTLLPNRAWLWRQLALEERRAQLSEYNFAVLFVDVDRFKVINDSFGHLAGDQVLQAVARRLAARIRPVDRVARFGGDEFVVLMKDVRSSKDVRRIAARIGHGIDVAGTRNGREEWQARVTVSIGAALSEGRRLSPADVVDRADMAMYRAKALGRDGRYVIDGTRLELGEDARFAAKVVVLNGSSNELD